MGLGIAIGAFLKVLVNPEFGRRIKQVALDMKTGAGDVSIQVTAAEKLADPSVRIDDTDSRRSGALQIITALQKEGRLLDFLEENLGQYSDSDIGSAVRSIHEGCKKVIGQMLVKKVILEQEEGSVYRINADYDAHSIKLSGRVREQFPLKGVVIHPGWQAVELNLPNYNQNNEMIINPAEVEVE